MPGTTQAADWVHLMGGSRAGLVVVVAMAGTIEEALLARASSKPALDASRPALDARASQARHAAPAAPWAPLHPCEDAPATRRTAPLSRPVDPCLATQPSRCAAAATPLIILVYRHALTPRRSCSDGLPIGSGTYMLSVNRPDPYVMGHAAAEMRRDGGAGETAARQGCSRGEAGGVDGPAVRRDPLRRGAPHSAAGAPTGPPPGRTAEVHRQLQPLPGSPVSSPLLSSASMATAIRTLSRVPK